MNLKCKIILIILCVLLIICLLFFLFINIVFGRKMNPDTIINKFNDNKELFEASEKELINYESMWIEEIENQISVFKREKNDGKVNIIQINDELYKYEHSINLIKELKLNKISISNGNIFFQFNTMISFGQYIVKINNEESYKEERYNFTLNMKELENNWYYIEME